MIYFTKKYKFRHAFSLVELVMANAIMATLMLATCVLVQTSYQNWNLHEQSSTQKIYTLGAHSHCQRHLRQATDIATLSASPPTLYVLSSNGDTHEWVYDSTLKEIHFSLNASTPETLASGIESCSFSGFDKNGILTNTLADIQSVVLTTTHQQEIPGTNPLITVTSRSWIRSW